MSMQSSETQGETSRSIGATYFGRLADLLRTIDLDALHRISAALVAARDAGRTIYVAGNGGSSATGAHWVNDIGKATKRYGRPPIRIMALSDNTPWLTALGNDEGYHRVFSGQLENFATSDDVLVVISASGSSPNLVEAVHVAKERRMVTIGLLGFDGGRLAPEVDVALVVETPPKEYELVEDCHSAVCHALSVILTRDLPAGSDHVFNTMTF